MEFIPPLNSPWSSTPLVDLNSVQKWWLAKPNALTDGLRALGTLQLSVLNEYEVNSDTSEAWMVGSKTMTPLWVREIVMSLNGIPVVAARSLCQYTASHAEWEAIRGLSNRPLADLLYTDPRISRSHFCYVDARDSQHLATLCLTAFNVKPSISSEYLVRASQFLRGGEALVVMECFTPAFWQQFAKILPEA